MSTNQENLSKDETLEVREPQTEMNQHLDHHLDQALRDGEFAAIDENSSVPQTGMDSEENAVSSAPGSTDLAPDSDLSQTDPESVGKRRGRKKSAAGSPEPQLVAFQSGTETAQELNSQEDGAADLPKQSKKRAYTRPAISVLSIDDRPMVETEADKAQNDLLDLIESQKTGRILTGTIQGVERPSDNPNRSFAVLYHGEFKVIIPAEEAVEPPVDLRGRSLGDVLHYMLTKRLGAEVDYIIKGIDPQTGLAVGSRLEAMRSRRKEFYQGTDRSGNYLIYEGVCAEARIVSVIRAGIFIDLFGLEVYIPLRELSYQRWMDAAAYFQPGQRVLVKVLEVDRSERNNPKVSASVKQAAENPYEKALRKYSIGNRYVGTVSMVDVNGVFVALDGGIDCLCSYPKRGRPPRGARATVRILGISYETNRIWGVITHIATPR